MRRRSRCWVLGNVTGITLRPFQAWCDPVHWLMTVTLDDRYNRDGFIEYIKNQGIDCRQMVNPVHRADHLISSYKETDFTNSIQISTQSAHLPSSTHLREKQIEFIVEKVKDFFNN